MATARQVLSSRVLRSPMGASTAAVDKLIAKLERIRAANVAPVDPEASGEFWVAMVLLELLPIVGRIVHAFDPAAQITVQAGWVRLIIEGAALGRIDLVFGGCNQPPGSVLCGVCWDHREFAKQEFVLDDFDTAPVIEWVAALLYSMACSSLKCAIGIGPATAAIMDSKRNWHGADGQRPGDN